MGIEEIKKKNSNIKGKIKDLNFSHTSHFFGASLRGTSVKKKTTLFLWPGYLNGTSID